MPQPIPPRARTVEQKILDLILHYRALNEEVEGINDQGQATGISEEHHAIEYDMDDLMQMMEGRIFRLRSRIKTFRSKELGRDFEDLLQELPKPHA